MDITIIGVDPGLSGAVVAMLPDGQIYMYDMPVRKLSAGSSKNQVDPAGFRNIISQHPGAMMYIERVGAMPRKDKKTGKDISMGTASAFNFGYGAGILHAIGVCFCNVRLVVPTVWKRYHSLLKTEKDDARLLAISLHPELSESLKRKKDSGRADALLIAKYGVAQYENESLH